MRPNCGKALAPFSHLLRSSRGAPADCPAGRRARSTGPCSPRDGLGAGVRLAALLPAGARRLLPISQGCKPRRPGSCAPGRPRPEKLVVRAPLSARSQRAREAAKRRGHGLGEPLLLPGTAGPTVRAGAALGLSAPCVPDARLHQPLGSQDCRRLPGGQPHREQVRLHQHRTGNDGLAWFSPLRLPGEGGFPHDIMLLLCSSVPFPLFQMCSLSCCSNS